MTLRRTRLALIVSSVLAASAATGGALADVVHLKNGNKVEGRIVSETADTVEVDSKFGKVKIARADVESIEKGDTPIEALVKRRAALAKDDAKGRVELALEAQKLKKKALADELVAEALAIDPKNVDANRMKGLVPWQDRFVTPEEKEKLEKEKFAAEMGAKGLVEYQGRFVTPADKEKLEHGFVLKDGKWVDEVKAKAAEGLVKVGDQWLPEVDVRSDQMRKDVEAALAHPVEYVRTAHVAVYTDVSPAFAKKLADLLERGFVSFAAEFETGDTLEWFGPHRPEFFVWKGRPDYETFLDWTGKEQHLPKDWVERAKVVVSVHLFDQWPMAATYVGNRGEENATAHCANMLGHVLLNRFRCEHRKLPPFLDESFAALTEFDLMGKNVVFTVATGSYAHPVRDDERAFFEAGNWIEPLKQALRTSSDTPMDQVIRREHGEFSMLDVAKGMALYQRWRAKGKGTVKRFFSAVRDREPGSGAGPTSPGAIIAVEQAFVVVEGKPPAALDPELRAEVMKRDH